MSAATPSSKQVPTQTRPINGYSLDVVDGNASPIVLEKKNRASARTTKRNSLTETDTPDLFAPTANNSHTSVALQEGRLSYGNTTERASAGDSTFLVPQQTNDEGVDQNQSSSVSDIQVGKGTPLDVHGVTRGPENEENTSSPTTTTIPPLVTTMLYTEGDGSQQKPVADASCSTTPDTPDISSSVAEVVTDADDETGKTSGNKQSGTTKKIRVYRHDPYAIDKGKYQMHSRKASEQSPSASVSPQMQQQQQNFLQMQYYQLQLGRNSSGDTVGSDPTTVEPQHQSHEWHRETANMQEHDNCTTSPVPSGKDKQEAAQNSSERCMSIPVTQSAASVQYEESILHYYSTSQQVLRQTPQPQHHRQLQDGSDVIVNDNDKNVPKSITNNPYGTTPTSNSNGPSIVATASTTEEVGGTSKAKVKIATISFSLEEIYHCNSDQAQARKKNSLKSARLGTTAEPFDTNTKVSFRARAAFRVTPGDKVVVEYLVREKDLASVDFYCYESIRSHSHKSRQDLSDYGNHNMSRKKLAYLSRTTDDSSHTKSRNVILCKHLGEVVRIDEEEEALVGNDEGSGSGVPIQNTRSEMILPRILRRATSTDIRKYELLRLCDAVSVTEAQRVVTKLYKDGAVHECCQQPSAHTSYHHSRKSYHHQNNEQNILDGHLINAITNPKFLQILLPPAVNTQRATPSGPSIHTANVSPLVVRSVEWLFDKSAAIVIIALPSPFAAAPSIPRPIAVSSSPITVMNNMMVNTSQLQSSEGGRLAMIDSLLPAAAFTSSPMCPINERNMLSLLNVGTDSAEVMTSDAVLLGGGSRETTIQGQRVHSRADQSVSPSPEDQMHYMPVYRRLLPLIHHAIAQRLQTHVLLKVLLTE